MMARIDAQEQLSAINATALGSGAVKRHVARPVISRLERDALGGRHNAAPATPEILAGMGIAVEIVPAPPREAT